ncbi:hypothetical protein K466DRAFT_263217 [Polyporus arcularius HHB13444]|uniref:Uncharacterized protein n=1 Tax=Polyporus arcularius HHB13444 TaxID=1314778 RepID=A0A5C3PC50_9APHY|nr:hypothetical protein K466DRAFT_263217 [Polyporus arcularius HHB13444]
MCQVDSSTSQRLDNGQTGCFHQWTEALAITEGTGRIPSEKQIQRGTLISLSEPHNLRTTTPRLGTQVQRCTLRQRRCMLMWYLANLKSMWANYQPRNAPRRHSGDMPGRTHPFAQAHVSSGQEALISCYETAEIAKGARAMMCASLVGFGAI